MAYELQGGIPCLSCRNKDESIQRLASEVARLAIDNERLRATVPRPRWSGQDEVILGAFAFVLDTDGWRLEVRDGTGDYWILDSGEETGDAGKAAAEAAYRKAAGL